MHHATKTIVLIHGLYVTPRSWEHFRSFFEARGNHVLTPSWPRMHGEVEEIRQDPSALAGLGLWEIADHYAAIIDGLDEPPILMGHSMGGLIVQMLLDRGYGRVGVAIDSATPKGIYRLPLSVLRSSRSVLSNPLNYWRTVALTYENFRYAFAHVMPESEAREAYRNYVVPGPGRPIVEVAFGNFNPWAANRVNFRAGGRVPLLLIAGEKDHLVPAVLNKINHRLYRRSPALTAFKEFPGRSHLIIAQAGWQEVADYALTWAQTAIARDETETAARTTPRSLVSL